MTEGVTDAEFLRAAFDIRRPHLSKFVRFYDQAGVPGGASAALNNLKSFAAAGISNRVIALLDNDTAAAEALRGLRGFRLPSHYVVTQYPPIPLGDSYPALGPSGPDVCNVNGRAGAIELYLGRDSLTDPDTGALRPVVWTGLSRGVDAYQGEIIDKGSVHQAFRRKVAAARDRAVDIVEQDWSGLDAILDLLVGLLRTTGVQDPADRRIP